MEILRGLMLGLLTLMVVGFASAPFVFETDQSSDSDDIEGHGDSNDNGDRVGLSSLVSGAEVLQPEQVINVLADSNEEYYAGSDTGNDILVAMDGLNPGGNIEFVSEGLSYVDGSFALSEIDPGEGDDHIEIESGSVMVYDSLGSDTIDAHGLTAGVIHAGVGDLVLGSDVANDGFSEIGIVVDGATVIGGLAEETILVTGPGSIVDGGGGDDYLVAFEGDAVLVGGDGDDNLLGNGADLRYCECTRVFSVESYSNSSIDTLDGGSGNDKLELSRGDVGAGGEGLDEFTIYNGGGDELAAAIITDFSPSEDSLVVQVGGGSAGDFYDSSYDLMDRVTVSADETGTVISVDGEVVAVIEGAGEFRVGIPEHSTLGRNGQVTTIVDIETGQIGSVGDFEALVYVFHATSS